MASLCKTDGGYCIRLSPTEGGGKRAKISLGKVRKNAAATAKNHVEQLAMARMTGHPLPPATVDWLSGVPDAFRRRLHDLGMCAHAGVCPTVSDWLDAYIATRRDVKAGTKRRLHDVAKKMKVFFADDRLDDVTVQHAKNFKIYLRSVADLGENTARRHIGMARQFFNAAIDAELITKNPFKGQPVTVRPNEQRFYFISPEMAAKVLNACPGSEWRLIFGLARYGGMRCPSEVLGLKWQDVDFEHGRFVVHSSKTEHHDGGIRTVPMFPELRPLLQDSFDQAEPGAVYCITKTRSTAVNLRTHMMRIIRRAGLEPWPKLFQNLRSTRETELFKQTNGNIKAVCSWIGNSPAVAMAHYAQVTEADYRQAAERMVIESAEKDVESRGLNRGLPTHEQGCTEVQERFCSE